MSETRIRTACGDNANRQRRINTLRRAARDYQLYLLLLPAVAYMLIFCYWPMYGIMLAFKEFNAAKGILGSAWVGFEHFERFFSIYTFRRVLTNTISISIYGLVVGFPFPIALALVLNELRSLRYKKFVQTVTYAPYFISTVVITGMLFIFLSPDYGFVSKFLGLFGVEDIDFMNNSGMFQSIYVWSGLWQGLGFGSIIYVATLASVSPELHEAAIVEGATRLQRLWYINLPALIPISIIILILNAGSIMSVGFEKIYLMQTPLNMEKSDVISTYVYRVGLLEGQYGFSTAVGLFNSAVNVVILVVVNSIARRFSETSLW